LTQVDSLFHSASTFAPFAKEVLLGIFGIANSRVDESVDPTFEQIARWSEKIKEPDHRSGSLLIDRFLVACSQRSSDCRERARYVLAGQRDGNEGDNGDQDHKQSVFDHARAPLILCPRNQLGPKSKHVFLLLDELPGLAATQ
jgi:hypothetical protein